MIYYNNAIQTKRELLMRIVKLLKKGELLEKIDRIPVEMRPKSKHPIRCCVHKDRAVVRYKIMAILGFDIADETDELTPLKRYAHLAMERKLPGNNFLTVVDEACSSCVQVNYTVSNLCMGCEARSCQFNCPKDAITVFDGKAHIDQRKCINCGLCQKACPYHAIAYIPVPCEEACPVKAISKNDEGIQVIDHTKCIDCGRCMNACPFGAILEKTQVIDVFQTIQTGQEIVAMVAPALLGQFQTTPARLLGAIRQLGFTGVMEVAEGADITARHETHEWQELVAQKGEEFITSSCCPSYMALVNKHIPGIKPKVSHTRSPMYYTAELAKQRYPKAKLVFVSPCLAKRQEAKDSGLVDFVLTIEELEAYFKAYDIDLTAGVETNVDGAISKEARGFAMSGGVANAIRQSLPVGAPFKPLMIEGLNKKNIGMLRAMAKKGNGYNFIEVMSCEGGCVNGPCTVSRYEAAKQNLVKVIDEIDSLQEVDEQV
ncbi:[FeFe] hydrogenase (group B1/B3) [Breznakibacter xylanolyticus]|uniref:[FeFe] hydrogenase (Group B1/B3) n=1 Tax=Breznakibacter xylanolyticus TaxID=990 RepID=A0A2W7N634_9BACT|nr:monomeric [FeFe] hydrogenase [Breznakibacter xylanolyticus]PZX12314.1 [FeFe] hydrogenase (group B1/B3) [Breznakibacter xylanolyticus]